MRRIIREEEPPKPSTRISALGQAATTLSTQRKSDPRKLIQLFRGELDWMVMKALEKDRNRRYETAGAFAADVKRYLNDEPVLACPPSALYRLRKFAQRNKLLFTTALVIAATLFVAATAVTWKWRDAEGAPPDQQAAKGRAEGDRDRAETGGKEARADPERA